MTKMPSSAIAQVDTCSLSLMIFFDKNKIKFCASCQNHELKSCKIEELKKGIRGDAD